MFYQCAPEPEDVIAQRRLSDGRTLAVFRLVEERSELRREQRNVQFIAGEVIVDMSYVATAFERNYVTSGYALVITDDTHLIEKWRTLARRRRQAAILRLFAEFREGMDNRRKFQTGDHPRRRASDTIRAKAG